MAICDNPNCPCGFNCQCGPICQCGQRTRECCNGNCSCDCGCEDSKTEEEK